MLCSSNPYMLMPLPENDALYRAVSIKIRDARKRQSLTQQELADRIGLKRTSVVNMESGRQHPPFHVMWAIAEQLGIEIYDLIPKPQEVTKAASVMLTADKVAKIEEAADGNPTVRMRLLRFLEEEISPKETQ